MEALLSVLDAWLLSAVGITMISTYVIMWVNFKVFDAIAIKSKSFKKFIKNKVYRTLKPIYPVILGGLIGMLTFKLLNQDTYVICILKGMGCGKFAELVAHVIRRRIKLYGKE